MKRTYGDPRSDQIGTVRRDRAGKRLAILIPGGPPKMPRWIVTDLICSLGYEADEVVVHCPIVGVVPFSPAGGVPLDGTVPTPHGRTVELPAEDVTPA